MTTTTVGAAKQHERDAACRRRDGACNQDLVIFMGKEEEEWLEDDENLSKWENNEL